MTDEKCPDCGCPMEYNWGELEWADSEVCTMSMCSHRVDGPECRALAKANKRIEQLERERAFWSRAMDLMAYSRVLWPCADEFGDKCYDECLWPNNGIAYPCGDCQDAYILALAEAEMEAEE